MGQTLEKPRVLITHWVHPEVIEALAGECEVLPNLERKTWPRDRVLELARQCAAVMMFMPDRVDEAFLSGCPRLRIVAAALKGYDNFDVAACTLRRVWLTCVPDLLTVPTAELAVGLLIAVSRRFRAGDDHVRSGAFRGWRPELYGSGLAGKTLGLVGLGAVGQAISRRLAGFGMRILYADPERSAQCERELALSRVPFEELLAASDYLLPLVHLKPDTFHMLDAGALARMKPGAILVNVARGSLVDEAAVAAALASERLAGYAADVFEMEDWALDGRPRAIHPDLLADKDRTFFTPHLGSAVDEARREIALEAARNILEALRGARPRGAVNAF
jgi:phosphonate dehydrogenase